MFSTRFVSSQRSQNRVSDPLEGFGFLGLGTPSTLWFAEDQGPGLFGSFVTRYGFAWSKNQQDGGTLSLSTSTWGVNSLPTVNIAGGGTNVRVGLRCDAFSPGGASTAKFVWTFAGPCYYASAFAPSMCECSFNGGASDNDPYFNFWNAITPGVIVQINGVNHILAAWTPVNTVSPITPAANRRGLFAMTARTSGANVDIQYVFRNIAGTYVATAKTITSASVGNYSRFAMGYNPRTSSAASANSSNLSFGGGVGWRVGATQTQLLAILDKWQTLYPLS